METMPHDQISRFKRLYNYIGKINVFDDEDTMPLIDQLLTTRVFIFLFSTTLTILIVFTAISVQTSSVTIPSPSPTVFGQLSSNYPGTLSCPCTHTSVRQDEFLVFDPQYHPLCSSQFVQHSFISSLSNMNSTDYHQSDYRVMGASHFLLLDVLCRTVKQMVLDSLHELATAHITTTEALLLDAFNAQTKQLVRQLQTTAIANMRHTSDFLWLNIFQNGIFSGLRTNYHIQTIPGYTNNNYFTAEYTTLNDTCSCRINTTCIQPARFYNYTGYKIYNNALTGKIRAVVQMKPLFQVPGMMSGCLPYSSLLQSTLECFYNQSCINRIRTFMPGFAIASPILTSRFGRKTTVQTLLDELFIESWNEQTNFTGYFHVCSPHSCTYSYDGRFKFLYIVVTMISLFGGLRMVTFFSAPLIVKVIRRLQRSKCRFNSTETETDSNQTLKERLISTINYVKMKLVTLNIFRSSSDVIDGVYSTRMYVVCLTIGIMVLVFYTSISVQTRSITVHQPLLSEYEDLYRRYSSTVVCPCTRLSVSYSSIMHIEPRYHEVCSSDFIKDDAWLLYFRRSSSGVNLYVFDFRSIGVGFFSLLQTLCKMSKETVTNELTVFNDVQFISTRLSTKDAFNRQMSTLILHFQQQTVDSFLGLFELVRTSIQLNQFIVHGQSNALLHYVGTNQSRIDRFVSASNFDDNCSCGTSVFCTRPQGFYCTTTRCKAAAAKPNQTISGLLLSCLAIESFLVSSLQCFYDASCIEMLIQWYSFDLFIGTIDPCVANVTPLSSAIDSRFPPDTLLSNIVSQLFIEDWTNTTNFSSYYNQCAPAECTYSYEERFNKAYIVATMLGMLGGLLIALQILIPPVMKLLRRMYRHCCRRQLPLAQVVLAETSIGQKCSTFVAHVQHRVQYVNLYKTTRKVHPPEELQTSKQILVEQQQRTASRLYIFLFLMALAVIITFTTLTSQTHSVTISSPVLSTFEVLQSHHSSSLSCPCSRLTIQYSKFISVEPVGYHQVCSSYFISSDFIALLWRSDAWNSFFSNIDGKILATEFRLLSSLCALAKMITEQKMRILSSRELITPEAITRQSFQSQIDSIVNTFIVETPASFRRIHQFIIEILHANQLHNIFFTNWNFRRSTAKDGYYMLASPILYNESDRVCSCDISSTCSRSLLMNGNKTQRFPGLVCGCLPVLGLRLSALECFYNSTCLKELAAFMDSSYVPSPLNMSVNTRFTPISSVSIGTLIDELFIESWRNTSNYSSYFSTCAPLTCRYSYVQRNSVVYMLTTFLGLYGGLTVGLKFVVWYGLCIQWKVRRWFTDRRRRMAPDSNVE